MLWRRTERLPVRATVRSASDQSHQHLPAKASSLPQQAKLCRLHQYCVEVPASSRARLLNLPQEDRKEASPCARAEIRKSPSAHATDSRKRSATPLLHRTSQLAGRLAESARPKIPSVL